MWTKGFCSDPQVTLFLQNPYLIVVVLLIASGLFMFTFKSTQFNMKGFIMVLLASFIGGIRWTLTQVLIQKAELGQLPPNLEIPNLGRPGYVGNIVNVGGNQSAYGS